MNQINAAVATANETNSHNPVVKSTFSEGSRLISPCLGYKALWKLKNIVNSLEFFSKDLSQLKTSGDIALTAEQVFGLDAAIFSIQQEAEDVRKTLSDANNIDVFEPVIDNVLQAENQLSFLLSHFHLEDGFSSEMELGYVPSVCINLANVKDTLYKAYKQVEKFAQYNFHVDADLYKEGFSVIISISDVINKLEKLIERFVGDEEGKIKVLQNRKKTTKKIRRLCESAWTLISAVPSDNEESQRLHRAHDDLFHVFESFRSKDIVIDLNDLAVFSRILEDAKDN
ncbi:hypothetical protein, partial [Nitrosomonas sp.]|uniref:hypothetical protein n=1 Tax=Nitrosomonas sp. TaxID=42353 RepID=UPI0028444E1D